MKNHYYEKLIASSKMAAKKSRGSKTWDAKLGVHVYHVYDGKPKLSWWDDTKFKRGSQMVAVFWTHPRYEYENKCKEVAREMIGDSPNKKSFLDDMVPQYKKLGKNKKRKKIVSYLSPGISEDEKSWYELWNKKEEEVLSTSDIRVKPFMKTEIGSHAKFVNISIPIEIYSAVQLKELAVFVNKCLDDYTLFNKTYGDYSYGRTEYLKDKQNIDEEFLPHSHGVNC